MALLCFVPQKLSGLFFSMERCAISFSVVQLISADGVKNHLYTNSPRKHKHEFSDPEMHLRTLLFIVLFIYAKEKLTDIQSNRSYNKIAC